MKKKLILLAFTMIFALVVPRGVSVAGDEVEIFVQMGHSDFAKSVAWSHDGRYAVTLSGDNNIIIWEASTGREIRTLSRHEYAKSAVFSQDGRHVLSGGAGDFKLWETATGQEIKSFPGDADHFTLSPDGRFVLSASDKTNGVRLWEISTGNRIRNLQGHLAPVISVKFSPDGRYALSGSADSTARLWDVSTGVSLHTLGGHSGAIFSVAFSPDGRYAVSGSADKTVRIWDLSSGRIIRTLEGHSACVISVGFSPDGQYVLSASIDRVLKCWNVSTGREIGSVPVDFSWVSGVAFSPDGKYVMSGSEDRDHLRTVKLWDVKTGQWIRTFQGYSSSVRSAVFGADGKQVLTGSGESLNLWDVKTGRAVYTVKAHSGSITSVAVSHDGRYAATGGSDKNVKLWELSTGKELRTFQGHADTINSLAFSPDGRYVLSGSWDRTVRLWETTTGKELIKIENPAAGATGFNSVVFSSDGKYVLSGSADGAQLWDVSTGKEVVKFYKSSPGSRHVTISPDGRYALSDSVIDSINLWEVSTGRKVRVFKGRFGSIGALAFSPDGRYALSGTSDKSVRLWDVSTGREIKKFPGHSGVITSVGFSPDGKYVLSRCANGTTKIWNTVTGGEFCTMVGFNDGEWIVITPEGYYNSSLKGHEYLNIRQGIRVYGIDQFYDVFYRPDIVNAKLNGDNISGLVTVTIEDAIKNPPPVTEFTNIPKDTGGKKAKVCYRAKNMGGGIGEIRLFHNGKLIQSDGYYREAAKSAAAEKMRLDSLNSNAIYADMRSVSVKGATDAAPISNKPKGNVFEDCMEVDAVSGENEVSVSAFNGGNTVQSYMKTVKFNSSAKTEDPHLYIMAVGINRYKDNSVNLKYAVKDAKDIENKLKTQAATLYKPQNIHDDLLTDERATKIKMAEKINKLSTMIKPQDGFILFVAGHGVLLQNQYYILTHDYNGWLGDTNMISSNEIVETSKKIKSLSQLFIFDTCHAGGVDTIVSGLYDARMSVLAKKMGLHIYASANDKQTALDGYKGNGLFTYTLLDGLNNNRAADKNKDGRVGVVGLGSYTKERTTTKSKELGHAQTPLIINFGKDYPIYRLR